MTSSVVAVIADHICPDVLPDLSGADREPFEEIFRPGHLLASGPASFITGGADAVLLSPGQAYRLSSFFDKPDSPALIVCADWMNMPRLDRNDPDNAVSPEQLLPQKVLTAEQALTLVADGITIYLFLGSDDNIEATAIKSCAQFVSECRKIGFPCIIEPLAFGANALKIPDTGDGASFHIWSKSRISLCLCWAEPVQKMNRIFSTC
jgi:DhnA family fructose-bisphosphate aldolase class Ia